MKNGHIFFKMDSCFYILIERIKKIIILLIIDKMIGFILWKYAYRFIFSLFSSFKNKRWCYVKGFRTLTTIAGKSWRQLLLHLVMDYVWFRLYVVRGRVWFRLNAWGFSLYGWVMVTPTLLNKSMGV